MRFSWWSTQSRRQKWRALLASDFIRRKRQARFRPQLEALEVRCVPAVVMLNSSFAALNHATGFGTEPPDTTTAAGPKQIVELVNFGVAFYDKTGALVGPGTSPKQVETFNQFFGSLTLGGFLFDPVVTYDDVSGRFVLSIMDRPNTASFANFLDVAISNDSSTNDGFSFHRFNVQETSGADTLGADNQRIGWNADAWVLRSNMIDTADRTKDHTRLDVIFKSNVTDHSIDGPNATGGGNDLNFGITPATMHGSAAGDPLWLVSSSAFGGSKIRVWEMTNVLNDATRTLTPVGDVSVPAYGVAVSIADPGGTIIKGGTGAPIDDRVMNASARGNTLVTCFNAGNGTVTEAHWYQLRVSGATAALAQSGVIHQGTSTHTYYPAIDIAANGALGMSFMESSSTERMSMYVTGRAVADAAGTMARPFLVQAGQDNYRGSHGGDYSGISVDPQNNSFWAGNEYATSQTGSDNWGTAVANFLTSTVTWTGKAGDFDWDTPGNWSTGSIPSAADDVLINTSGITVSHSMSRSDSVHSLTSNAAINISSGQLYFGSASTVAALTMSSGMSGSSGTITGPGSLTISGQLTWTAGTMAGNGTTVAKGGISFSGSGSQSNPATETLDGRTLTNTGPAIWSGTNNIVLSDGAVINNVANFTVQNNQTTSGSGVFNNFGTFTKSTGGGTTTFRRSSTIAGRLISPTGRWT